MYRMDVEYRDEHGKLHRPAELGPAVIKSNDDVSYYDHGFLHRPAELGPAVIKSNGDVSYYEHGSLHRPAELGPAVIFARGNVLYYEHGFINRPHELGPAIIYSDGSQEYIKYDEYHRPHELGPAVTLVNGEKFYYENGNKKTIKEFKAIYKIQRWFRWHRFLNKHCELFEKVLGLPANHESVLGKMFPEGGDLYKETYKDLQKLLESF